jgi:DNA-binding response OmpR family regulator
MRHKGRVLSRTSIVEAIWGYNSDVEENTLDVFIRLLRQKVELPEMPKLIRTVRGVGYCLQEQEP